MTDTAAALARWGETMRKQQQNGPLSTKQLSWIADGYNLGYLDAEEAKTRFGQLIDDIEQRKTT